MRIRKRRTRRSRNRQGAAAVETAVIAPILVLLFLGAVDAGQYANCYQKVSDASREGARYAARFEVSDASQVETTVMDYLGDRYPGIAEMILHSVTQVTVRDAEGNAITGGTLASVDTGSPVEVVVSLQFDTVRWIGGLPILDGRTVQIKSVMRRE